MEAKKMKRQSRTIFASIILLALETLAPFKSEACRPFGSYAFLEDKEGGIWFTEGDNNAISRLAPDGTIKLFPMPTENAEPVDLAFDGKGNVWFVEMSGNMVGRLSKDGKITEYPIPTHHSHPVKIAVDSKGEAWFTENGGKIGRLTNDGKIVEYPIGGGWTTSVAVDGKDNVWVAGLETTDQTDLSKTKGLVGIMSREGKLNTLLRRDESCPMNIMAAPSGDIWFSDRCRSTIEKMDKDGRPTAFKIDKDGFVQDMVMDKNGSLWFADRMRNRLGRISAGGKLEEFPLPGDNGGPFSLIVTKKGELYFSEILNYNMNKRTKEGVFEEFLMNVDFRKEVKKVKEGEVCRLEFAAKAVNKMEMEKKRAEEVRLSRLKDSGDGSSKTVEESCATLCHDAKRILLSRKTDWRYTVERMQENRTAVEMPLLSEEKKKVVTNYLNLHYSIKQ